MSNTTWRQELVRAALEAGDTSRVVHVAPKEAVLDVEFDDGYGLTQGPAVLIWTEQRVYFPVSYDGSEWLGSAPRDPQAVPQHHIG